MREPKTPLPWLHHGYYAIEPVSDKEILGAAVYWEDVAYAVHAANALPEVLAALRLVTAAYENVVKDANIDVGRDDPAEIARAALAKAEGAPEGGA